MGRSRKAITALMVGGFPMRSRTAASPVPRSMFLKRSRRHRGIR